MNDKPSGSVTIPETFPPPPQSESNFRQFQRRPRGERAQSGKVLPPPPAWMVKPLKPPRARTPTSE
ncbi:MAG TPA: hypothetical protein VFZ53_32695 [Polyangiaceae bacterium]